MGVGPFYDVLLQLQQHILRRQVLSEPVHGRWELLCVFEEVLQAVVHDVFEQLPDTRREGYWP